MGADGVSPPASTTYTVSDDKQVELAAAVAERGGVQPLVTLAVTAADECDTAAHNVRADIAVGATVAFSMDAAVPPGAGKIVRVEWDFESTGTYPDVSEFGGPSADVRLCATHSYDEPAPISRWCVSPPNARVMPTPLIRRSRTSPAFASSSTD